MTELQKEYCEEKGLIYIKPENTEISDYVNWLETQIQALRIHDVSGMLCGSFDPDNKTSSATKCKCGREKWEHPKPRN